MTILWLVVLPLAMALVALLIRELPLLVTPLSAATLLVVAILAATQRQAESFIILNRSIGLLPQEALGLSFCSVLLTTVILHSYHVSQDPWSSPLVLAAMAFFTLATMVRNAAIAGLFFEIGAIAAIMLIPSNRPGSAMAGMRTLVLLALSGPLLLMASWAIESRAVHPDNVLLARLGGVTLAIGFGIGLAIVPFHVWLPPVFRYGSPLSIVMLSVVMGIILFLRLSTMLQVSMWPGGQEFFSTLLLAGGGITAVIGGIMALPQRSINRVIAYAALADLGLVLVGLGVGKGLSLSAVALHLAYRGIGIVAASMGLGALRQCLDGDDVISLQGALRRAPLAIMSIALGGFSLVGLPLTAGFTSRLLLYRALAGEYRGWAIAIIALSLGPAWALMRCIIAAIASAPTSGSRHEPLLPGLLALSLGMLLLILGLVPHLWSLLPPEWLTHLFSGILTWGGIGRAF
jgi:formate hydrogenlyase subunit 3/multisubunit Na+/H+ antiporter MnhD subunit